MKNKSIIFLAILICLFLLPQVLYAKPSLLNVLFFDQPEHQLIFEFDKRVNFEVKKSGQKLYVYLDNTLPKESKWIKTLPKELFKEVEAGIEKDRLALVFTLSKDFNFQASMLENRLVIRIFFEEERKVYDAMIIGDRISKLDRDKFTPDYKVSVLTDLSSLHLPLTKKYKGQPISIDFQEADLHAVFRFLAEVSGLNIVVSDKIKGMVTLKLHRVPWDQVLDIVLANYGLGYAMIGNVMRIVTIDEIKAESDRYKDYLTSIKDIQERGPLTTKTFQLKYVKGEAMVSKLKEIVTGDGKITYEPNSNVLIVKDTEKNLKEIETIIKEVDKPTKQVLIEARVVEIMDTYAHRLGIRWSGSAWKTTQHTIIGVGRQPNISTPDNSYSYPGGFTPGNGTGRVSFSPSGIVDLGVAGNTNIGFAFGHVGKSVLLLDAELSALESEGVARIFATPKVLTLDNQPAEIKQGYKIPYLQLNQQGVATTQFIEAVLRLKVTPHVAPDNRINLDVEIEKSTPDWGRVVNGVPALITRSATTKTLVNNGETIVIGGIKTSDIGDNVDQVPGLGKIPGVGEAFKKKERNLAKTELIVFITPKIITVEIPGVDY
jgi:type IV pilus assembly protein PilQ